MDNRGERFDHVCIYGCRLQRLVGRCGADSLQPASDPDRLYRFEPLRPSFAGLQSHRFVASFSAKI